MLGRPIGHSLSPVIHNAGYAAAGLTDWSYDAHDCGEAELAGFVAGLGPEWAGLSLTMPLKEVALKVADAVSDRAAALGAANTLARRSDGTWWADNTDAPGMVDALRWVGVEKLDRVSVLGAGGTARAALAAAAELGASLVTVYARRRAAVDELAPVAAALGVRIAPAAWPSSEADADVGGADVGGADVGGVDVGEADAVISTVPKGVADPLADRVAWRPATVVFDVVYDPWPTPLAAAAQRAGCRIVSGLDLLLAQAVHQFELFTGVPAPVAAMREALYTAAAARTRS
ncbi:MAG: shikimate dehydrogenase [Micromonosporaceae bacterium]|nr:shikimate dehydrogenase [Micromonosporaceae bacterium]